MNVSKKVSLALTEFAVPSPLVGSIDVNSGFGRASEIGLEIHREVQAERALKEKNYRAEVAMKHTFEFEGFSFAVEGRADGFIDGDAIDKPTLIEEIKSSFNLYDLQRRLRETEGEHPYSLQLRTYGYIHWLQSGVQPELRFHLVSSRNREAIDFEISLDLVSYERWLARRLKELAELAREAEKRAERRKAMAQKIQFPFAKPRLGQVELIQSIADGLKAQKPMLIQAPTGLGKTMGVLYPSLQEALSRGQKVVYVTPKNSQHSVAEDAVDRLRESNSTKAARLRSLTITAKSKLCFKNEPICNPDFCEYAKDHYTKVAAHSLLEKLAKKKKLTARVFEKMGREFEVCPFELQLDSALDVETVICDYNYVFAPRSAFGRLSQSGLDQMGKPNLVVDEAHNLPARAMDYFSPSLSILTLERMLEDAAQLPKKFRADARRQITECIAVVRSCGTKGLSQPHKVRPITELFLERDYELRSFLSSYLSSDVEVQARDVVMRLSYYWAEFTAALEWAESGRPEFFTTFSPNPGVIKITCSDASEMLKASYAEYQNTVAFSATLKPFDYYSQMMGLSSGELLRSEFLSPFDREHRKVLIIPQISSKYSDRERNYPRIADAMTKIMQLQRGNYLAFFPSFDFLERVRDRFQAPVGTAVISQERFMRNDVVHEVLEKFRDPSGAHILFAVQGGVFSEGIDYPGSMAIGAFVVGPPLPQFDLERELRREYYDKVYRAGFDYAYTFPAMAKAVQAAGRVIRSETDRGIIVLMDDRFTHMSYSKSMPQDWFDDSPRELVSEKILSDVAAFWKRGEAQTNLQSASQARPPVSENSIDQSISSLDTLASTGLK